MSRTKVEEDLFYRDLQDFYPIPRTDDLVEVWEDYLAPVRHAIWNTDSTVDIYVQGFRIVDESSEFKPLHGGGMFSNSTEQGWYPAEDGNLVQKLSTGLWVMIPRPPEVP